MFGLSAAESQPANRRRRERPKPAIGRNNAKPAHNKRICAGSLDHTMQVFLCLAPDRILCSLTNDNFKSLQVANLNFSTPHGQGFGSQDSPTTTTTARHITAESWPFRYLLRAERCNYRHFTLGDNMCALRCSSRWN